MGTFEALALGIIPPKLEMGKNFKKCLNAQKKVVISKNFCLPGATQFSYKLREIFSKLWKLFFKLWKLFHPFAQEETPNDQSISPGTLGDLKLKIHFLSLKIWKFDVIFGPKLPSCQHILLHIGLFQKFLKNQFFLAYPSFRKIMVPRSSSVSKFLMDFRA